MAGSPQAEMFQFSPDDPLAAEHGDVAAWVEEAVASRGEFEYYRDADLKNLASGQKMLDAKPEQSRRYVVAAVIQARHWDEMADRVRAQATSEMQRINAHHLPGWNQVWARRIQATAAVTTLMRRALPFRKEDLLIILHWCLACENLSTYSAPIGHITRALNRYADTTAIDSELRDSIKAFAQQLRSSHDKDARRYGTAVEQLCATVSGPLEDAVQPSVRQPPPRPAPAGIPTVLVQLKQIYGMLPVGENQSTTCLEPDRFQLRDDSPLRGEHERISELFNQVVGTSQYYGPRLADFAAGQALLGADPATLGQTLLAAAERHVNALVTRVNLDEPRAWQSRYAAAGAVAPLAECDFSLSRDGLFDFLLYLSARPPHVRAGTEETTAKLMAQIRQEVAQASLSEGERYVLSLFRASRVSGPPLGADSEEVSQLTEWIGDGAVFCLVPGEAWSDAINDELREMSASQRRDWIALFAHLLTATAARPSGKWLKTAAKLVEVIGKDHVQQALGRWLPLVSHGQTIRKLGIYSGDVRGEADVIHEENATCLRGLLWLVPALPCQTDMARLVTAVALSAYKKVPGVGPRAVKVGNAAIYVLSEIRSTEAVGQLAMLKVRVKFGTAQKEIEKAFNQAAEAIGLPRDQIEEMAVPAYGLTEIGLRCENLGEYRAELTVSGSNASLQWFDAAGKSLKSVPARVKKDHKDDLDELKQALKDIQTMLPAQRDRIDSMFLLEKSWPIESWKERYLAHPLVGTIARRLLWCIDGTTATFTDGEPADLQGNPIAHGRTAEITLWHPVGHSVEEVTGWRRRLEELGVVQPFKQAHREVYLLTDAERRTNTYSNRFAAHVIRQHQFNALCAARGWRNKLRLMVDDVYPPACKELPQWGLRAEFWVEGIGENYGTDTNESGVYLLLTTDQVRFYRSEAAANRAHAGGGGYGSSAAGPGRDNMNEPVPLEQIPPLVLSEIMRDVDLFVGVASVGNDPAWQDGGPHGRYRDYWQSYSFGELSGTAITRRQVLERLVPRLKIANRCSFSERFLLVRGDKRTYKIHLGSGNILMEPNDQYLCIVPDSRSRTEQGDVFLPFEGDSTLSIIISKALLLAEDTKIKDPTILQQINR